MINIATGMAYQLRENRRGCGDNTTLFALWLTSVNPYPIPSQYDIYIESESYLRRSRTRIS
jgi:hypothetical protein